MSMEFSFFVKDGMRYLAKILIENGRKRGKSFPTYLSMTAHSFLFSTKSDLTIPACELTWYIVEVTGWGAYETGWLEIRIAFVIARCVTSWQSSVEPAHCGVTGWHIRRTPRCRTVQQTPCNNKEKVSLEKLVTL